jgi:cyclic pyranopterin phosphate synthase
MNVSDLLMKSSNKEKSMKDSFDRSIDYLRISVTDRCNLKCIYCRPSTGLKYFNNSEIITDEEIVRFIGIAHKHGLRKVRITGGEPLMRRNITSLISSIKSIGIQDLSLTTNGIKLSGLANDLKKAGLDRVNISLDTMDASRYRAITNGGNIHNVWESIHEAERVSLSPVKINTVPIKGLNDDEILDFASLTLDRNFHVRFIEFMPAMRNGMWEQYKYISSADVLKKIRTLGNIESFEFRGKGPSRNFRIRGAVGVIGIISPLSDHFCSYCNRLRLTSIGKIRPCLFSKEEIDIKSPMRNGASDQEIEQLYCHAIKSKPERHLLNDNIPLGSPIEAMSQIGG